MHKIRIAHLTSVHSRFDIRIFVKMCSSLAKEKYSVFLVVADGQGDEVKNNVSIIDVGAKVGGRLLRITKTVKQVYDKAVALDAQIYHLHDPELIPVGLMLKRLGKIVVFDAHEDLPKQLLSKQYLNKYTRKLLSKCADVFEKFTLNKLDAVVAATPFIRNKFNQINRNSVDINNYPRLEEFIPVNEEMSKQSSVCYVGGISKLRGIKELVRSMEVLKSDATLTLAGNFMEADVEDEVKAYSGWARVNELGWLDRKGVSSVMNNSIAGLVTLHPIINYQDALPVKMFEYMAAGIPVIASNITLWQQIIESARCGICVNPLEPNQIAKAIDYLSSNPTEAKEMGQNGREAVLHEYNWSVEEKKLFRLYDGLLSNQH